MTRFDTTNRPRRELTQPTVWYDAKQISPNIGLGNDDAAGLLAAVATVDALGGGGLIVPTTIAIASDVDVPRTVVLAGVGASVSQIKGLSGQRRLRIRGVPADSPSFAGDAHIIQGLTFDAVSLDYAPVSGDAGRGCWPMFCEFVNNDRALYYGYGSFAGAGPLFCKFRLNTTSVYFDLATAASGAGAHLMVHGCQLDECENSIYVNGITADGIALYVTDTYADHVRRFIKTVSSGEGGIYVKNCGVELCGLGPGDVPFADGYFIENEGCNIYIDGLQAFAIDWSNPVAGARTDGWIWNKSGFVYIQGGIRGFWAQDHFARIDGGAVIVEQGSILTPLSLWGQASAPFAAPGSSGGKVMAPRSGFVGTHGQALTSLTNASPTQFLSAGQAYDGNNREWTFELTSSNNGTTYNILRLQLADGVHSVFVDLILPRFAGGGRVRVVHKLGSTFEASITYAPSAFGSVAHAAGATPTGAEFNAAVDAINQSQALYLRQSVADTTTMANQRFLLLTTVAPSGTASTMTVSDAVETISGSY